MLFGWILSIKPDGNLLEHQITPPLTMLNYWTGWKNGGKQESRGNVTIPNSKSHLTGGGFFTNLTIQFPLQLFLINHSTRICGCCFMFPSPSPNFFALSPCIVRKGMLKYKVKLQ